MSSRRRKSLPKSVFGLPGSRRYPMPDKAHARNAKSRAAQAQKAGNLSKKDEERIDRKADKILDK